MISAYANTTSIEPVTAKQQQQLNQLWVAKVHTKTTNSITSIISTAESFLSLVFLLLVRSLWL